MVQNNDLRGLNKDGFQNDTDKFDEGIFKSNETIELIRPIIQKYFTKSVNINKSISSYGLKHIIEKHLGSYVSNGELIYAMHLEGFKIMRCKPNACFNIKISEIKQLESSKDTLQQLSKCGNYVEDIEHLLKYNRRFSKYKYHFNLLIHLSSSRYTKSHINPIYIIAKEISEEIDVVKNWFNISKDDPDIIPTEKMKKLEIIFNSDSKFLL